ncbi:unnamed protein product [Prunus armeniaca]|uniref:Uncharacterized protein n=1 Tax=Prunus armeniaca TaxID=36596 RepID=A0A6J5TLU1_PRUAR|nr:hypothetical protein GBA52_014969 [Prunus armeniaca]CAB4263528.1 unnamed protein product [Prunus armeniaca]
MTTGRINQVAFLSDVGSVQDKRPCGSSARRGARQSYVSSENASNWTIGGPKTPRPLNAPHPRSQAETCGPSQSHDESWVDRDTSTATTSSCCPRRARGGKGQREAPFLNNR